MIKQDSNSNTIYPLTNYGLIRTHLVILLTIYIYV